MIRASKNPIKKFFKDFGYKVIRLKYFIMVVGAMLLEITTLVVYLLNNENVIGFDLFTASVLYGVTSVIMVVLAVGCLVLIKFDKTRDKKKISLLFGFKKSYQQLKYKYSRDINRFMQAFDTEKNSIDVKMNYATVLEDLYDNFLKEFSDIKIPNFLNNAFRYESDHLSKEIIFYSKFSSFSKLDELEKISKESDLAHKNFMRETEQLEKSLKIIV